jgi:hypothetical protein
MLVVVRSGTLAVTRPVLKFANWLQEPSFLQHGITGAIYARVGARLFKRCACITSVRYTYIHTACCHVLCVLPRYHTLHPC